MGCKESISSTCDAGHKQSWKCGDGRPKSCQKCEREAKLAKERQEREIEAQKRREIEQRAHLARMDALNAEIAKEHRAREDARLDQERAQAIKQKEDELAALNATRAKPTAPAPVQTRSPTLSTLQQMSPPFNISATASAILSRSTDGRDIPTSPVNVPAPSNSPLPPVKEETTNDMPPSGVVSPKPFPQLAESPSKTEWSRQKNMEGASNPSIDAIMDMTGLEEVKKKVLDIKTKIDVSTRQNASLKNERFNAVFLGNPGTGRCSRLDI